MLIDVDGRPAYAYIGGQPLDRNLPVVVMIHGAQHDHSVWALQSRYLAHHGRAVLAVDLPGHGRSAGPPAKTVEAMAAWVLALLAAAGVARASLVGHSMGSLIALEAAARSTAIEAIALVATAYPMRVSATLLEHARDAEPRAIEMISLWSSQSAFGGRSQKPGAPGPGFAVVEGGRRLMERQAKGVLHTDFLACDAYANGDAAAAAIRCPTLVVLGGSDAMTAARSGRALAARIANARVVEIPGAAHFLMAEAPDATLDALAGFLPRGPTPNPEAAPGAPADAASKSTTSAASTAGPSP